MIRTFPTALAATRSTQVNRLRLIVGTGNTTG